MSEYNLKESEKGVGQLYPVLIDAKGNVIDGFHRLKANPKWRTEKVEHIDSEEKLLEARCKANWHRRQVSREEKEEWINGLARIYKKQGLQVRRKRSDGKIINEIVTQILKTTGLDGDVIRLYLVSDFKQVEQARQPKPRLKASERIEHRLGRDYVERHREEVIKEVTPKIKEELLKDRDFVTDVISRAPEIIERIPPPVIDEGKHIPTITAMQAEEAVEAMKTSERELAEKRKQEKTQKRALLVKNWMAHGNVVGVAPSLRCPTCGAHAENLVWKCHPQINVFNAETYLKKQLEE